MNWGMRVLQTLALPLGYVTEWKKEQVLCKNPYISALCGFSYSKNYNTKNSICKALKNADPCRYPKRLPARRGRCRRKGHDFFVLQNVNSTLLKTAIFDRCFFAFLSVPRTFELLFHGRNTLLNHVFLINDSVNICLFSKSGNSLIILFNIQKFRAVPASSWCRCSSFFIYALLYFRKEVSPPMSYVLTLFPVLFLTNSRELTPIHIWVIEFVIFCVIACIIGIQNEK